MVETNATVSPLLALTSHSFGSGCRLGSAQESSLARARAQRHSRRAGDKLMPGRCAHLGSGEDICNALTPPGGARSLFVFEAWYSRAPVGYAALSDCSMPAKKLSRELLKMPWPMKLSPRARAPWRSAWMS